MSLVLVLSMGSSAFAYSDKGLNFVAPQVSDPSNNVGNPVEGEIVYDTDDSTFKGYDGSSWQDLGAPSSAIRFEYVSVRTTCTGSPCTAVSKSSGVLSVTRNSTGDYNVNFDPAYPSLAPTCVCFAGNVSGMNCLRHVADPSTSTVRFVTQQSGTNADGRFEMVCMGPSS